MQYIIDCPSGASSFTSNEVVCVSDPMNSALVLPPIGQAELALIFSSTIAVMATAWGFRMLGVFLFNRG